MELEGLENEIPGAALRIEEFYRPLLDRERGREGRSLRVLDSGCGNGMSVDLLEEAGFDAWGVDLSMLRKWQWRERRCRERLACADGGRLPFSDGFFDAILCSGVLEHVGVTESGGGEYRVTALPGRDAARIAFLAEHARVLSPGGVLWLDFPNGAFPIDFWHGPRPGGARWHGRDEGFLPTTAEVRRYAAHSSFTVRALSASGRLRFRQVSRHWWGRLLSGPAALWLWILGAAPFGSLLESGLNPFLVLELRAGPSAARTLRAAPPRALD